MSQHRFTTEGQTWTVGYDAVQATFFAQVEVPGEPDGWYSGWDEVAAGGPPRPMSGLDDENLLTVVGDKYGQVRSLDELETALAEQVLIPEHVMSALRQDGPARVGPAELAAASATAHRWLEPDTAGAHLSPGAERRRIEQDLRGAITGAVWRAAEQAAGMPEHGTAPWLAWREDPANMGCR